jgi:hypothetical protein
MQKPTFFKKEYYITIPLDVVEPLLNLILVTIVLSYNFGKASTTK